MSNNISKNFRLFSAHVKYYGNVFLLSNINVFKHFISLHKKIELRDDEEKAQP